FDVVFIIMLCDGFFPLSRVVETPDGEEEERRLFYVAITRARNELYLSYPLMRAGYGGGETRQSESRFVRDLPRELLEEWNLRQYWSANHGARTSVRSSVASRCADLGAQQCLRWGVRPSSAATRRVARR